MQIQSSLEPQAAQQHQGVSSAESGEVRQNPQRRRNKNETAENRNREFAIEGDDTVEHGPAQVSRRLQLLDLEEETLP
jgi:hypothetical protein